MLTVVGLLVLDRGQVVAGGVQPAVVVPVDPFQGRQFDVVDASPGPAAADQLGLEQPDLALGQGVVQCVADSADAACGAGGREALAEFVRAGKMKKLDVERANGEPVVGGPLEPLLVDLGFRLGPKKLTLTA